MGIFALAGCCSHIVRASAWEWSVSGENLERRWRSNQFPSLERDASAPIDMTVIARHGQVLHTSENDRAVEKSSALARSALDHWKPAVRGIPFLDPSGETSAALSRLVDWYERICIDDLYNKPAPLACLDALIVIERSHSSRRVVMTHWAVRVAQELVEYRRELRNDSDSAITFVNHAKLDVALQGAFDRLRDDDFFYRDRVHSPRAPAEQSPRTRDREGRGGRVV